MQNIQLAQAQVAVIGAGIMGMGIAQLAAMQGHHTIIFDLDVAQSQRAIAQMTALLQKRVLAGKMTQQLLDRTLANLVIAEEMQHLADADLVIEAIVEKKQVKQHLFQQLAQICPPSTIFASNTSSISITAIAAVIPHPERVVGLHFFNPAPVMKLVEIIRGLKSSAAIADALFALMQAWGKVPVTAKSTPGFIVNRIARPYYAEAFRALQENVTTPQQLDFVMRECGAFAMGPCELTDLIGQDVNFSVTQSVYEEFFYEPRYRPSLIQKELVDAGCLGRKTQQGFYDYRQAVPQPQYELPVISDFAIKASSPLKITVKGQWQQSSALIQRLQQCLEPNSEPSSEQNSEQGSGQAVAVVPSVQLAFEAAAHDEIILGEVTLRLSQGESVDLDHAQTKMVLMDWHADWANAKAIAVVASSACTEFDRQCVVQFFSAIEVTVLWMQDHPGLCVLRSIAMLVNEACEAVLHAIASEQDIDAAMKYGVNYPEGPFQWAEKIGYSTIFQVLNNLYRIYAEERYRPSLYLSKKVARESAQNGQQHLQQQYLQQQSMQHAQHQQTQVAG